MNIRHVLSKNKIQQKTTDIHHITVSVGRSNLLHRTFLVVRKISTPFLRHFRVGVHRDILIYGMVGGAKNHAVSSIISIYEEIRRNEIGIFSVNAQFHKDISFLIKN